MLLLVFAFRWWCSLFEKGSLPHIFRVTPCGSIRASHPRSAPPRLRFHFPDVHWCSWLNRTSWSCCLWWPADARQRRFLLRLNAVRDSGYDGHFRRRVRVRVVTSRVVQDGHVFDRCDYSASSSSMLFSRINPQRWTTRANAGKIEVHTCLVFPLKK